MNQAPYPFTFASGKYHFTSRGKIDIQKRVQFVEMGLPGIYHLGFGDLLADGSIDDLSNSNNGDILKVFITVICIVKDFLDKHPNIKIFFTGSTRTRTLLYERMLRMYYVEFGNGYIVSVLVKQRHRTLEIKFSPLLKRQCLGFFVKKK